MRQNGIDEDGLAGVGVKEEEEKEDSEEGEEEKKEDVEGEGEAETAGHEAADAWSLALLLDRRKK